MQKLGSRRAARGDPHRQLRKDREGIYSRRNGGFLWKFLLTILLTGVAAGTGMLIGWLPFAIKTRDDFSKPFGELTSWTGPPLTINLDRCTLLLDTFSKKGSVVLPRFCTKHLQIGQELSTGGFSDTKLIVEDRELRFEHTGDIFRRYDRYRCQIRLCLDVTKPVPDLLIRAASTGPSEVRTVRSDFSSRLTDKDAHSEEFSTRTTGSLQIDGPEVHTRLTDLNVQTFTYNAPQGSLTLDRFHCQTCNVNTEAPTSITMVEQASGVVTGGPSMCIAANSLTSSAPGLTRTFSLAAGTPAPAITLPASTSTVNIPNTTTLFGLGVINTMKDTDNDGNMQLQVVRDTNSKWINDGDDTLATISTDVSERLRELFKEVSEDDPVFDYLILEIEGIGASCGIWVWTSHHTFHKFPDAFLSTYTFGLLAGSVRKMKMRYETGFCPPMSPRVPVYSTGKGQLGSYALRRLQTEYRTVLDFFQQSLGGGYFGELAFRSYLGHCPSQILDQPIGFDFSTELGEYIPKRLGSISTDKLFGTVYVLSLVIAALVGLGTSIGLLAALQSNMTEVRKRLSNFLIPKCSHVGGMFSGSRTACNACRQTERLAVPPKEKLRPNVTKCEICESRACAACQGCRVIHWGLFVTLGMSPHVCWECKSISESTGPFWLSEYLLMKALHLWKDFQIKGRQKREHQDISNELNSVEKYFTYAAQITYPREGSGAAKKHPSTLYHYKTTNDDIHTTETKLLMENYVEFCHLFGYQPVPPGRMRMYLKGVLKKAADDESDGQKRRKRKREMLIRLRNLDSLSWSVFRAMWVSLVMFIPLVAPLVYGLTGLFNSTRIFQSTKILSFTSLVLGGQWIFQVSIFTVIAYFLGSLPIFGVHFFGFSPKHAFQQAHAAIANYHLLRVHERYNQQTCARVFRGKWMKELNMVGQAVSFYTRSWVSDLETVLRGLYLLVAFFAYFVSFFHVVSTMLWLGLGTIIRPQRVAPYAVGVTALVAFVIVGKSAMNHMRRALYEAIREHISEMVDEKLAPLVESELAFLRFFKKTDINDFKELWTFNDGILPLRSADPQRFVPKAITGPGDQGGNTMTRDPSVVSLGGDEPQAKKKKGLFGMKMLKKPWGKSKEKEATAAAEQAKSVVQSRFADKNDAAKDGILVTQLWYVERPEVIGHINSKQTSVMEYGDAQPADPIGLLYKVMLGIRNHPDHMEQNLRAITEDTYDDPEDDYDNQDDQSDDRKSDGKKDDDDSHGSDGSRASKRSDDSKKGKSSIKDKAKETGKEVAAKTKEIADKGKEMAGKGKAAAAGFVSGAMGRFGKKKSSDDGSDDSRKKGRRGSHSSSSYDSASRSEDSRDRASDSGFFSGIGSWFGGGGGGDQRDDQYSDYSDYSNSDDNRKGASSAKDRAMSKMPALGKDASDKASAAADKAADKAADAMASMKAKSPFKGKSLKGGFGKFGKKGKDDDSAEDDGGEPIDIRGDPIANEDILNEGDDEEVGEDVDDYAEQKLELTGNELEKWLDTLPMKHSRQFTSGYTVSVLHNTSRQVNSREYVHGMRDVLGGQPRRWRRAFLRSSDTSISDRGGRALVHENFVDSIPFIVDELAGDLMDVKFPLSQHRLVLFLSILFLTVILVFYFLGLALFSLRGVSTAIIGSALPALTSAGYGLIRKRNQDAEVQEEKQDMPAKLDSLLKTLINVKTKDSEKDEGGDDKAREQANRPLSFDDFCQILDSKLWLKLLRPGAPQPIHNRADRFILDTASAAVVVDKWRRVLTATHSAVDIRPIHNVSGEAHLMKSGDNYYAWRTDSVENDGQRAGRPKTSREQLCDEWEELHHGHIIFKVAASLAGMDTLLWFNNTQQPEDTQSIQDVLTLYEPPASMSEKAVGLFNRGVEALNRDSNNVTSSKLDYKAQERRVKQSQTSALSRNDLFANEFESEDYSEWSSGGGGDYYYQGDDYYNQYSYSDEYSGEAGGIWPF